MSDHPSEPESVTAASDFPIVGIGASAGGLEAVRALFASMPPQLGVGFVLVVHLDPTHQSLLSELLDKSTPLSVVQIEDSMPVVPDRLHVIPPNTTLTIVNGRLQLHAPTERRGLRLPIDAFFCSLAEDRRERAIAIVLSGNGSDGMAGVGAIKANGGLAMAQEPGGAAYDGMPRSAIASGHVDHVLPVEAMVQVLASHVEDLRRSGSASPMDGDDARVIGAILALIETRLRQDFRGYKRGTLDRRIQRRFGLSHQTRLADYHRRLCDDDPELRALCRDLLIGVTAFFRDPEAWQVLRETLMPELLQQWSGEHPLRVWVAGCATGEEAYSMAMLLIESIEAAGRDTNLSVFATDVDLDALAKARGGVYPERLVAPLGPERLARFFVRDGEHFQVKEFLRERVIFAPQNLISDPPFSNIDLISCRNLLIYIEAAFQDALMARFHFALREGGYLFLGTAETSGDQYGLFTPISATARIYRRGDRPTPRAIDFLRPSDSRQPRDALIGARGRRRPAEGHGPMTEVALLKHFTPAAVLVDRRGRVLYYHGPVRKYLGPSVGDPTDDVLSLIADGLRGRLRDALRKAVEQDRMVVAEPGHMRHGDGWLRVHIRVMPIDAVAERPSEGRGGARERPLLIVLEDMPVPAENAGTRTESIDQAALSALEEELRSTRDELHETIEQMDASTEDLQVSNEEVMSMNEELRSTNEELETSKEELQSLNEELITMNIQLAAKIRELEETNDDLNNLLVSSEAPTLFLDPRLNMRRWTPATNALLRLIPTDVGRPLLDLTWRFEDPDLLDDAALVLAGTPVESREIQSEAGHWYLRRMLPYCTPAMPITGVVVTFTEMTARKLAELTLADSERTLRRVTDALPALISRVDLSLRYRFNNAAYERWFGLDPADIRGKPVAEILGEEAFERVRPRMEQALAGEGSTFDAWLPYQGDQGADTRCCQVEYIPDRQTDGRVTGFFALIIDMTERRRGEETIERLNAENRARAAELQAVFEAAPVGIYIGRDLDCKVMDTNRTGAEILRLPEHTNPSLSGPDSATLPFRAFHAGRELASTELPVQAAARAGKPVHDFKLDLLFTDGEVKHLIVSAAPLRNEVGDVSGCVGIIADVTVATQAEQRHLDTLERLKLHVDQSPVASLEWSADTAIMRWSPAAERVFGWSEAEALHGSLHDLGLFPDEEREAFADMIGGLIGGVIEHNHCLHLNQRKDGETLWCEWYNSVLRDGDGRLVSVLSLALDVSDEQALQRSLREQTDQLAEADRRKNTFLAMLGHELRNPLAAVRNALDLLALDSQDQAKRDWAYAVMDRQTRHLQRLVHDLLDVARITRGSISLSVARQDLGRLVHQALEVVDRDLRARGHELVLEVPLDSVPVRGDATRLVQVLSNVLQNAIKFTDQGGRLRVTLIRHADGARVVVEDNGQGIDPKTIPSLFDAFTQGPRSLARAEGGLGLGLTLVRNLVGLHGGRVEMHSAGIGLGSRVTLTFPLDAESPPEMPADQALDNVTGIAATACKRVLVVDDSADVMEAVCELLVVLGHEVSGVSTGGAALAAVPGMRPDVILLDIGLPDIDGIEVARRLAERPERKMLRLVAVSGYDVGSLGKDAGLFDEYLLKPVGVADLKRVLE